METNAATEFDGECAFAVSTGKREVAGSHKHRLTTNGKTYLFSNGAAKFLWKVLPNRESKAEAVWAETAAKDEA